MREENKILCGPSKGQFKQNNKGKEGQMGASRGAQSLISALSFRDSEVERGLYH